MARQYQDLMKIKTTIAAVGAMIRENARDADEVLYCADMRVNEPQSRAGRMPVGVDSDAPAAADPSRLKPFAKGAVWGGRDADAWFRVNVDVTKEMAGKDVWMEIHTGREGGWNAVNPQFLVFVDGKELQGADTNHTTMVVAKDAVAGRRLTVDFDAWSGAVPAYNAKSAWGEDNAESAFKARVFTIDDELQKLYFDMKVPFEVAELLAGSEESIKIQNGLRAAADILDLREPGSEAFRNSARECLKYMEEEFYGKICDVAKAPAKAWCVGHTHIDVAWLWQYRHTVRKSERSFATALNLMERYPEYIFMSSQPQLYKYVKERRPDLYGRINEMVKSGQWDPEGGMWVEADCNLSSGEALIRQFAHGKKFFKDEFGADSRILWLPDVFGYSAALPQICKKCGIEYFMTTKINWNELNKLPGDAFIWKGVDGTEILTHFIPSRKYIRGGAAASAPAASSVTENTTFTTYNSMLDASEVLGGWQRYQQKDVNNDFMISYGYGDGGGGTTWEMVENLRRMARGIPGCPVTAPSNTMEFFERLEKTVLNNPRLPRWSGELYLEFHRGTYTSIAKNKRNNRKSEQALQSLEALSAMAVATGMAGTAGAGAANNADIGSAGGGAGYAYPAAELDAHWKTVLLNQFHDVLPNSSIKEVYEDTDIMYAELLRDAAERARCAKEAIAAGVSRRGGSVAVFNALGFDRSACCITETPENQNMEISLYGPDGDETATQATYDGKLAFRASGVPGMGWKAYTAGAKKAGARPACIVTGDSMENGLIKIVFDGEGRICSLFDITENREVLKAGKPANALETYEDRPGSHDSWDIAPFYIEKRYDVGAPVKREVLENGPVRAVIGQEFKYLKSEIRQKIIMYGESKRIDFETEIDWREEHIMLKAAFPVDILADKATYEIQYGAIERPTHFNTTWEHAKFETCAQKWADLSEDGYGVSILNDCKYGHAIHGDTIRLTLLRSATAPCIDADRGRHNFTYSILPHSGGWREAGTAREAYDLNVPLDSLYMHGGASDPAAGGGAAAACAEGASMASSLNANVNAEVLKLADDGGGFIVRVYEAHGRRGPARMRVGLPAKAAYECDMLENITGSADLSDGVLTFDIMPYEIKTFRLE